MTPKITYVNMTVLNDISFGPFTLPAGLSGKVPEEFARSFSSDVSIGPDDGSMSLLLPPAGGNSMLLDASGRPMSSNRALQRIPYADVTGDTIWFALDENTGNKVYDATGQLVGSIQGSNTTPRWGINPGLTFNGTNNRVVITDGDQAGFTSSARRICNLSTLVADNDMLLLWAIVSHPPTIPQDSTILSWGMNADPANKGGWAFGMKTNTGKHTFSVRPRGAGSATVVTQLGVTGAQGANSDNTRTAMALEICASQIAGLLEVKAYMLTLGTDGGQNQSNRGLDTPLLVPNGTGAPTQDVSLPLTLGAWADTSSSSFTKFMGAGMSIANVGLKRRQIKHGLGMRICRNLRDNPKAFPLAAR